MILNIEKVDIMGMIALLLLITVVSNCGSSQQEQQKQLEIAPEHIRRPVVAGMFYPANPQELTDMISTYLKNVSLDTPYPDVIGLVSPHAGIVYSGQTAAYAYKQVEGNSYEAVIIIAPSHREQFEGASVWAKGAYQTPLGLVPVHEELAAAIMAEDEAVRASRAGHRQEHSLEVQLPFLQLTVKDLKIVPIVVQDYSFANCQRIAGAIVRSCQGKNVLLVASTDLYHGESYADCRRISGSTLENIAALEPKSLHQSFRNGESQACGAGPVVIVEMVAQQLGANQAQLLHQTNSNDVTGQKGGYVVGYGALVFYHKNTENKPKQTVGVNMGLSLEDKKQLMDIARTSIENAVRGQELPKFNITSPILKEKRGAFVTIHKNERLRGCIGYVMAYKPLYQTVSEMAKAAALHDPRFPPVQPAELDQLALDISVLTPIQKIDDVNEIEVGKHGLIIEYLGNSGLLLPQVATENNWDTKTFLEHTCLKAGLPKNTWKKEGVVIKIFSADVFSEADLK